MIATGNKILDLLQNNGLVFVDEFDEGNTKFVLQFEELYTATVTQANVEFRSLADRKKFFLVGASEGSVKSSLKKAGTMFTPEPAEEPKKKIVPAKKVVPAKATPGEVTLAVCSVVLIGSPDFSHADLFQSGAFLLKDNGVVVSEDAAFETTESAEKNTVTFPAKVDLVTCGKGGSKTLTDAQITAVITVAEDAAEEKISVPVVEVKTDKSKPKAKTAPKVEAPTGEPEVQVMNPGDWVEAQAEAKPEISEPSGETSTETPTHTAENVTITPVPPAKGKTVPVRAPEGMISVRQRLFNLAAESIGRKEDEKAAKVRIFEIVKAEYPARAESSLRAQVHLNYTQVKAGTHAPKPAEKK